MPAGAGEDRRLYTIQVTLRCRRRRPLVTTVLQAARDCASSAVGLQQRRLGLKVKSGIRGGQLSAAGGPGTDACVQGDLVDVLGAERDKARTPAGRRTSKIAA